MVGSERCIRGRGLSKELHEQMATDLDSPLPVRPIVQSVDIAHTVLLSMLQYLSGGGAGRRVAMNDV